MEQLTKIASLTREIDAVASDVQGESPLISLALDRISDNLEAGAVMKPAATEEEQ